MTAPIELPKEGDSLLGKYILDKPLGQGGMGIVYAARHELLGQRVAVKFLLPEIASNGDCVARFLNEARAASRIESDHVARVLDVGLVHGALPYMVLEFLDGDDLAVVLQKRGPLPISDVADYVLEAIDALAYAHALGIVHRDLKPSNLFLVRRQDGRVRVKVLDFGISKMMGAQGVGSGNITKTNAMLGSPLYMSPEQLRDSKGVDHRCDIWALGVIAYELLTGHPPFMADNAVALFAAIQETEPVSPRTRRPDGAIPPELEQAVLRCLRRNPNERFASVTELGAALAPFATEAGAHAFQNAKRVLPLRAAASAPVTGPQRAVNRAPPATSPSAHTVSAPGGTYANTADPWSSSRGAAAQSKSRRGLVVALGLVGVLGLTGALAGARFVLGHRQLGEPVAAASAAAPSEIVAPSASAVTSVATTAPSAVSPPPSAASAPVQPPSATPAVASHPSPAPRPKSGPAVASAAASAPSPPVRSSAAPARNCDPPYTIDNAGHHVLKPGCE